MNQRFQTEEIKLVKEQNANNELYKAICQVGPEFEHELQEFGLCPEECFMETLELLSKIANKGTDILPEIDLIWLSKCNEYKRFDRRVSENEISKVVAIVFGFTVLSIDSSRHPFYRFTLSERITQVVASHEFSGWTDTLERIFAIPLPDGWFDAFIEDAPSEKDEVILPKDLNTAKARKCFTNALKKGYMSKGKDGKYNWTGSNNSGNISQLAYLCGIIYGYQNTISGNAGPDFPEGSLNRLFGVKRLYSSLSQVYNAKRPQRWRSMIDELCE